MDKLPNITRVTISMIVACMVGKERRIISPNIDETFMHGKAEA